MNILSIVVKEIKQNIRDRKAMIFMILFPIVLICVLGSALSTWFGTSQTVSTDMTVLYNVQGNSQLGSNFEQYIVKTKNNLGITYKKIEDLSAAKEGVASGKYSCLILIKENNMQLIEDNKYNFDSSFVENMLKVYVEGYSAHIQIAKVNPSAMGSISKAASKDYVEEKSLQANRSPRAIDYYAITMLTLIIMYAAQGSMGAITSERNEKTQGRILCGPVRKYEFLTGKILGGLAVTAIQAAVVILFSKYVLNTYWGDNIPAVLLVIVSVIILSVSIGTGISFIIKDSNAAATIVSLIVPFMVFLGGGYFPLSQFSSTLLHNIAKISPLDWANRAIFGIIYNNDLSIMPYAVLINLAVAVVLIAAAAIIFKKEEA